MKYLLILLLFAFPAFAEEPNTQKDCEQILAAFAQVKIDAGQADLVSQVQKGVVVICKRAIDTEKKLAEVKSVEEKTK